MQNRLKSAKIDSKPSEIPKLTPQPAGSSPAAALQQLAAAALGRECL